jgi:hypothetical protein
LIIIEGVLPFDGIHLGDGNALVAKDIADYFRPVR